MNKPESPAQIDQMMASLSVEQRAAVRTELLTPARSRLEPVEAVSTTPIRHNFSKVTGGFRTCSVCDSPDHNSTCGGPKLSSEADMSKHDKHKFRRSEFNGLCVFLNTSGEYCREEEGHSCHLPKASTPLPQQELCMHPIGNTYCHLAESHEGPHSALPQQEEPAPGPVESRFMAIMNSIKDEEADYIIGRCIPLLQILLHEGNEQAKEVLDEIKAYCAE
jgi:hypothetical protein